MIPTLSVPNIQVAPPVEQSVFTGQNADAALGRLPVVTVPPTVSNPKVADNRAGQAPLRQPAQQAANNGQGSGIAPFSLSGSGELAFESPYSTTFVAQLFGQFQPADDAGDIPLGFIDFDRLSQYDITRYMPSFAFRPRVEAPAAPPVQAPAEVQQVQQSAPSAEAPAAAPTPAPQPAAAQPAAEPASTLNSVEDILASFNLRVTEPVSTDLAPLPERKPETQAPTQTAAESELALQTAIAANSLFASGVDAYGATQSRNFVTTAQQQLRGGGEISLIL